MIDMSRKSHLFRVFLKLLCCHQINGKFSITVLTLLLQMCEMVRTSFIFKSVIRLYTLCEKVDVSRRTSIITSPCLLLYKTFAINRQN